jgi:hypothetical protein
MLPPETPQGFQAKADIAHAVFGLARVFTPFEKDDDCSQTFGQKALGIDDISFDAGKSVVVLSQGGHEGSIHIRPARALTFSNPALNCA